MSCIKSDAFRTGRSFACFGLACRAGGSSMSNCALWVSVAIFSFSRSVPAVSVLWDGSGNLGRIHSSPEAIYNLEIIIHRV